MTDPFALVTAHLLSLPAEIRLKIVLTAATYSSADTQTLRSFLLLCRDFYTLLIANFSIIVEHYTVKEELFDRIRYIFCGQCHRDNDLPAIIYANGTQQWYQHDKLHRDNDLPAIIYADGTQQWYQHGQRHRDNDLPAVIRANGTQQWYHHNELHRNNDLPAVTYANGTQKWYQRGKLHRDNDLPAIIWADGTQQWWRHDVFIRH